jgi:hypothetical protein
LFDLKWYEKFGVYSSVGVSTQYDIIPVAKLFWFFNITKTIEISPYAELRFSVRFLQLQPVFGVGFTWYMFKR